MIHTICSQIRFRHVVVTQVGGYREVPEEELKDEVSSMISKILEAYDNKQITESEKDKLVNMLQIEA